MRSQHLERQPQLRSVEVVDDPFNRPQLIYPFPNQAKIDVFFNSLRGKKQGKVKVHLLGSEDEERRKLFSNKYLVDWQKVFQNLMTTNLDGTGFSPQSNEVTLYIDDLIALEFFILAAFDQQYDSDPNIQPLRGRIIGVEDLCSTPGYFFTKALQHELDHAAKTIEELVFLEVLSARKLLIRCLCTFLLACETALLQDNLNTIVLAAEMITAIRITVLFGGASILHYLNNFSQEMVKNYAYSLAEKSARRASRDDKQLISITDTDRAWFIENMKKAKQAIAQVKF